MTKVMTLFLKLPFLELVEFRVLIVVNLLLITEILQRGVPDENPCPVVVGDTLEFPAGYAAWVLFQGSPDALLHPGNLSLRIYHVIFLPDPALPLQEFDHPFRYIGGHLGLALIRAEEDHQPVPVGIKPLCEDRPGRVVVPFSEKLQSLRRDLKRTEP